MPSSRQTYNFHLAGGQYGQTRIMRMDDIQASSPTLTFTIQPECKHRFRHKSELKSGSHGCIKGQPVDCFKPGNGNKKCFPTVQLTHYYDRGPVRFEARLFTHDRRFEHGHKLIRGSKVPETHEPVCFTESSPDEEGDGGIWTCSLQQLNILNPGIRGMQNVLNTEQHSKDEKMKIQHSVVIHVRAVAVLNNKNLGEAFSDVIENSKKTKEQLIIEYISLVAACAKGGEEGVILCNELEKKLVDKKDPNSSKVHVKFFKEDEGKDLWCKKAKLTRIHHKTAIIFVTPPYESGQIMNDVTVKVQLCGNDENTYSECVKFTYYPDDDIRRKRLRIEQQKVSSPEERLPAGGLEGLSGINDRWKNINSEGTTANALQSIESSRHLLFQHPSYQPPNVQVPIHQSNELMPYLIGSVLADQSLYSTEVANEDQMEINDLVTYIDGEGPTPNTFESLESSDHHSLHYMPSQLSQMPSQEVSFTPSYAQVSNNPGIDPILGAIDIQCGSVYDDSINSLPVTILYPAADLAIDAGTARKSPTNSEEPVDKTSKPKQMPDVSAKKPSLSSEQQTLFDSLKNVPPEKLLAYKLALHTAHCLHNFAKTGNVTNLLMSMRHLVALQDAQGDNAIHAAVVYSQPEAMRHLIEAARTVTNYDILNMCNEFRQSPLHIAVHTEQVNAVKLLLYHGGNPNLKDRKGNNAIHLAAQLKSVDCLSELLNVSAYATKYKNNVPDLDAMNYAGFTALHLAVINDSLAAVQKLCHAGCDVDIRDRTSGRTALHIAVEKHNLKIIAFLLQKALAETDIHMFNGNTPLHLACAQNHKDTVALLMQSAADPYLENYEIAENSEDDDSDSSVHDENVRGLTPLDLAVSDEVRSILRREPCPLQLLPVMPTVEEPLIEVVMPKHDDYQKQPTDSGYISGLSIYSNSGLGLRSPTEQDSHKTFSSEPQSLDQILDGKTKERLGEMLNPDKWREVLDLLYLKQYETKLEKEENPTSGMLRYIHKIEELEYILEALHLTDAVRVLEQCKTKQPHKY